MSVRVVFDPKEDPYAFRQLPRVIAELRAVQDKHLNRYEERALTAEADDIVSRTGDWFIKWKSDMPLRAAFELWQILGLHAVPSPDDGPTPRTRCPQPFDGV